MEAIVTTHTDQLLRSPDKLQQSKIDHGTKIRSVLPSVPVQSFKKQSTSEISDVYATSSNQGFIIRNIIESPNGAHETHCKEFHK